MRYFRKIWSVIQTTEGADRVVAAAPIPPGGALRNVWGEVHVIGGRVATTSALLYPFRGVVVPAADPDDTGDIDNIWDEIVPKDVDVSQTAATEQMDFDTITQDTNVFEEPGEVQPLALLGMTNGVTELFNRERLITFANRPVGFLDATPDDYAATEAYKVRVKRSVRVERPSYVMFAVGQASFNDTESVVDPGFQDNEWFQLTYLKMAIHQAWPQLAGLTEAGAESPFANMAVFLERLTEPTVHEDAAGLFETNVGQIFTRFVFEIEVPGDLEMEVISGG